MRNELGFFESAMIAIEFFKDCYEFWKKEGETDEDAFEGAYDDLRAVKVNPFDPNGQELNQDAVKSVLDAIKDVANR